MYIIRRKFESTGQKRSHFIELGSYEKLEEALEAREEHFWSIWKFIKAFEKEEQRSFKYLLADSFKDPKKPLEIRVKEADEPYCSWEFYIIEGLAKAVSKI